MKPTAVRVILIASIVGAPAGAAAAGTTPLVGQVEISQLFFTPAGWPALVANFPPDSSRAIPVWRTCLPGRPCRVSHRGALLRPGPTMAGATFDVRVRYHGKTTAARSPRWLGRVTSVERPRLNGQAKVGGTAYAIGGHWSGGWDGQATARVLRVEACETLRPSARCVTLSIEGRPYPGLGGPGTVAARYRGWYLYAIEERTTRDLVIPAKRYLSAEDVPPADYNRTTSRSEAWGPIS